MRRLIIAMTGASGAIYGIRALQMLRALPDVETHLVLSPPAARTILEETDWTVEAVRALAHAVHEWRDIGSPLSSGSFTTAGMLVAPCSVKTLSGIAHSYDSELTVRAADVCLKERRPLVLLFRETPLHAGHIELMAQATRNGAIIMPPLPAFYLRPKSLEDIIDHTVARALSLVGVEVGDMQRWGERTDPPGGPGTAGPAANPAGLPG